MSFLLLSLPALSGTWPCLPWDTKPYSLASMVCRLQEKKWLRNGLLVKRNVSQLFIKTIMPWWKRWIYFTPLELRIYVQQKIPWRGWKGRSHTEGRYLYIDNWQKARSRRYRVCVRREQEKNKLSHRKIGIGHRWEFYRRSTNDLGHVNRHLTLVISKMGIETTVRYYLHPPNEQKFRSLTMGGVGRNKDSYAWGGSIDWCHHFRKQVFLLE